MMRPARFANVTWNTSFARSTATVVASISASSWFVVPPTIHGNDAAKEPGGVHAISGYRSQRELHVSGDFSLVPSGNCAREDANSCKDSQLITPSVSAVATRNGLTGWRLRSKNTPHVTTLAAAGRSQRAARS